MSILPLGSRNTEKQNSASQAPQGTLESGDQKKTRPLNRVFLFQNLLLNKSTRDEEIFLLDFELQRVGLPDSGKTENPVNGSLLLRFKATGKEISLFSGLLGRQVEFEEERKDLVSEAVQSELQQLRDLVRELSTENSALKQYFMETQRVKRIS